MTLQYSKRPSPLSLGKVEAAREQNRLLWLRVLERLRDRPGPAAAGRAVRREPRRAHQPGRVPALGHARPAGARHRPGAVDRHALRQRVDARGHRAPTRRRPGPCRRGQRLRAVRRPAAPRRRARLRVRAAQPRQRRRHQVRPRPAHHAAPLARTRPPAARGGPRGQPARHPAQHALAAGHDVLPEPDRHEERPDARRLPGLGARLPPRPARFISEVYGLPATEEQLQRIEEALQLRETVRERLFSRSPGRTRHRHRVDPSRGRSWRYSPNPRSALGAAPVPPACSRAPPCFLGAEPPPLCGRPRSSSTTSVRSRSRSRRRQLHLELTRRPGRAGTSSSTSSPSASAFANADNRFATSALVDDSLRLSSRSDNSQLPFRLRGPGRPRVRRSLATGSLPVAHPATGCQPPGRWSASSCQGLGVAPMSLQLGPWHITWDG